MNEKVAPIPAGFTTITPHLLVKDAEEAFAFYQKAFGAKELSRQTHPSENWLLHLDLKIGNSILMLSGTSKEWMLLETGSHQTKHRVQPQSCIFM